MKDSDHQVWLLEMIKGETESNFEVKNATAWWVVSNAPHYTSHLQNLAEFMASNATVQGMVDAVDAYLAGNTTAELPTSAEYMPLPGGSESRPRFIRLAILNRIAPRAEYPDLTGSYMPADSDYNTNSALVTAVLLINQVTLSRAHMPDRDWITGNGERTFCKTQWRIAVDHTDAALYFNGYADLA